MRNACLPVGRDKRMDALRVSCLDEGLGGGGLAAGGTARGTVGLDEGDEPKTDFKRSDPPLRPAPDSFAKGVAALGGWYLRSE